MSAGTALAGLLSVAFGPIDIYQGFSDFPVSTSIVLSNQSGDAARVTYEIVAPGLRTAAGATSGEEELQPRQQILVPVRGKLTTQLYPLPEVRTSWETGGQRHAITAKALIRKVAQARRTGRQVRADGVLGEDCWLLGSRCGRFGHELGDRAFDPSPEWMVTYDYANLYFGMICNEPEVESLVASERERDDPALTEDESIELLLDCTGTRSAYHRFVVNAAGTLLDSHRATGARTENRRWSSAAQAAVRFGRARYYVELSIPFKALGVAAPKMGTVWLINVARNRLVGDMKTPQRAMWNANPAGYRDPKAFGALVFR